MDWRKLGEITHLPLLVPSETRTGAIVLKTKYHPMLNPKAMPSLQITGGEYIPILDIPCFTVTCSPRPQRCGAAQTFHISRFCFFLPAQMFSWEAQSLPCTQKRIPTVLFF